MRASSSEPAVRCTDGVCHTMIFDVVLLPEYQGRGLGREIMKFLSGSVDGSSHSALCSPGQSGFLFEAWLPKDENRHDEIL